MMTLSEHDLSVYQCLHVTCERMGVTSAPPTFREQIFGYLCPDCAGGILSEHRSALYCTSCRGITLSISFEWHGISLPGLHEPILFVDACPRCAPNAPQYRMRLTLLPDSDANALSK